MKKARINETFLRDFQGYNLSKIKEQKIFLVGSARFKDYFIKIESLLQIKFQKLVSFCSIDGLLNKDLFSAEEWERLQQTSLAKLKDQEAILVLDVNGYIGDHTKEEIQYFEEKLKRPVYYLSKLNNYL